MHSQSFIDSVQRGLALLDQQRDYEAAEYEFGNLLRRHPKDPQLWNLLGVSLQRQAEGRPKDESAHLLDLAETAYRKALEIDRRNPEFHLNLGGLQKIRLDLDAAIESLQRAVKLDPRRAQTYVELADVYARSEQLELALAATRNALKYDPKQALAGLQLALTLEKLGRYDECLAALRQAVAANPSLGDPHMFLATKCLAHGLFEEGWREYQFRPPRLEHFQRLGLPWMAWHTSPLPHRLDGAEIALATEQGIGDQLFFMRFAARLRARGARVSATCDARLVPMLTRTGIAERILSLDVSAPPDPNALLMGDLPFLSGMNAAADAPAPVPLTPLAAKLADIKRRLAACGPPPYVGITWRAGTSNETGIAYLLTKQVGLEALAAALRAVPGTFVCLQRKPFRNEFGIFAQAAQRPLVDCTDLNDDLEGMLALLDCLDAYVCVSNTNTHLRAGLGKPCHVLVPHPAEFRWMNQGDRTPWFPASPIFRQTPSGDWQAALDRLSAALA